MAQTAFLFPGQGSQAVGMGRALAEQYPEARQVFEAADDALGFKLSRLCFEGPEEELRLTANTQPAILTTSLAAHAVLSRRTEAPAMAAGHSLGEFSALCAMGALPLSDAVRAVRERGRLMQVAVPPGVGAMAAILGLDPEQVAKACAEATKPGEVVQPANFNEPSQTVISGHAAAVARASEGCLALGAKRVLPLPVSAPFHSALMAPVQAPLGELLRRISWKAPVVPVVSNVEAAPNADPGRFTDLLIAQVVAPVRWVGCVQALAEAGVRRVVEVGPGRVLCGLVRRIDKNLMIFNVEDPASLEKTVAGLAEAA
jgi:[acyl-carrier-protein] S-malonyltransferase